MKTDTVIQTNVSEAGDLLLIDEDGEEAPIKTLADLREATKQSLLYLRDQLEEDLKDIWRRLDRIDSK